jgi:ATP-dependent DNA helicase RecG
VSPSERPPHDLLAEPVAGLVGAATAKALASLDIHTVGDLLWHVPRRYARRGELTDLSQLRPGEQATVLARVASAEVRPMRRRHGQLMEVVVTDGRGRLRLTFFSVRGPQRQLVPGRVGLFAGTVEDYRGTRQLVHPEFLLLPEGGDAESLDDALRFAGDLIPVYPASAAISSWRIGKAVATVLGPLRDLPEPLPAAVRHRRELVGRLDALRALHDPPDRAALSGAQVRLRYEEAFVLQVELARRRRAAEALPATPRAGGQGHLLAAFDAARPFPLTGAQQRVGDQIAADLARPHPMHRLLHGDVGSGKTLVALRAMLAVVDAGGQAALLAPTEVLAVQHERSLRTLLGPLAEGGMLGGGDSATRVVLLTGSVTGVRRRQVLAEIAAGTAGIVVGTHALLSEHVQFVDLGLVVVDEQHRFGVEQRAALAERSGQEHRPHVLVMTATPIPRTVAMTVFGDLDVSVLDERPPGRSSVVSHLVPVADKPHYLRRVWERVAEEVDAGHRAFVVCPRIGGDEPEPDTGADEGWWVGDEEPADDRPSTGGATGSPAGGATVLAVADQLAAGPLAGVDVGVLHGRMGPEAKDEAMARFASGAAPVLVCTTVVEVGVDVPEATVMVVLDAERFGVAQLHQLRGRVGRGHDPGVCLLVTAAPAGSPAAVRLAEVARESDGFVLAELDLQQRREGDLLGAAQTGRRSSLRLLSLRRDAHLIGLAREDATQVVAGDPDQSGHPELAAEVERMTGSRADYLERT